VNPGERLLDVRDLHAGYGDVEIVHGLDLHVDAGEVVALLGPNGAGKTTTLRTISALVPPLAGEIEVLGETIRPRARRGARATSAIRVARLGVAHVPEAAAPTARASTRSSPRCRTCAT
jgi:branched-chain amino acid transport system ATP-binding protein